MRNNIQEYLDASVDIGNSIAYVQGGGGNTSLKINNSTMIVKSSGFFLSDMTLKEGYTCVNYKEIGSKIGEKLSEIEATSLILENVVEVDGLSTGRPSMETGFHSILAKKAIIHTHSVYANVINCCEEGPNILKELSSSLHQPITWVPYCAPGLNISLSVKDGMNENPRSNIFMLENHGVIVSGDSLTEALDLHKRLNQRIIDILSLSIFSEEYHLIQENMDQFSLTLSEPIAKNLISEVIVPDQAIYLSKDFKIDGKKVLFRAPKKQAKGMAQTVLAIKYIKENIEKRNINLTFIDSKQVESLVGMPSEKFRQNLLK